MRIFVSPLLLILSCCWLLSCKQPKQPPSPPKQTTRAFYYWKSAFRLSDYEQSALTGLNVQDIYVKFFDVVWNDARRAPMPVAPVQFTGSSYRHYRIHPVIFITNNCLQNLDSAGIVQLADAMSTYYTGLLNGYEFDQAPGTLQLDCDWTASTMEKYFLLLRILKKHSNPQCRPGSATIRLYQLKYMTKTGVPPVDTGMLMCYNMGNLKNPATGNSILETAELEQYIGALENYPLPCDVAFPLFDWYVWFSKGQYKGLLYPHQLPQLPVHNGRCTFTADTLINGLSFAKGDMLRYESSPAGEVLRCVAAVNKRLKNTRPRVILYHLDSLILSKYNPHELEAFFKGIH